jgi:hypothetical protein
MHTFEIVLAVIMIVVLVVTVSYVVCDEMIQYRERQWTARRAIEAEWRIHQIKSDAQARMWDEVARHQGGGG